MPHFLQYNPSMRVQLRGIFFRFWINSSAVIQRGISTNRNYIYFIDVRAGAEKPLFVEHK